MKSMVMDANIVFAILISKGKTDEIFFELNVPLYAPSLILSELGRYSSYLAKKSKRNSQGFRKKLVEVMRKIQIISVQEIFLDATKSFSPDIDDVPFLALALQLNCLLWSNDKRLKEQDVIPVFSTDELLEATNARND